METTKILLLLAVCSLCSCVRSNTNFAWRSNTSMILPKLDGESNLEYQGGDFSLQADKQTDLKSKVALGDLNDDGSKDEQ